MSVSGRGKELGKGKVGCGDKMVFVMRGRCTMRQQLMNGRRDMNRLG